jgi:transposase
LFWVSDEQWARIEPLIPSHRRGVTPKNNRRILSGIMQVLKTGCRWVDCPPEYGPAKTVYNRFNRWSPQGIWQRRLHGRPGMCPSPRGNGRHGNQGMLAGRQQHGTATVQLNMGRPRRGSRPASSVITAFATSGRYYALPAFHAASHRWCRRPLFTKIQMPRDEALRNLGENVVAVVCPFQ